jgi:hypothetical protein
MRPTGDADLLVAARRSLLDALEALAAHRNSVIVIGAQAIYMHTGGAAVALAETTKDVESLARRSRVVVKLGASLADVVVSWCRLSPHQRLALEPVPVG